MLKLEFTKDEFDDIKSKIYINELQGKDIYALNKDRLKNLSFILKMTILGDFFS